ncbi:MAG: transposase, partial [Methyloprofundus sp.]|nr:transposase [Methyloprofundus sp.]
MARPLRLEFPNALYHITSRGDRREKIYDDDEDRLIFLDILGKVVTDFNWLCHSYCLMDNHYHLIIETLDSNLSKGMRQLNGVYTQATNRRHKRNGHLFQGRYKAILVDKDQYLLELARYVVLNPLRAKGMVRTIEDWQWSSYLAFIGKAKANGWLTTDWVLSQFGRNKQRARENYQRFVLEGAGQKLDIWSGLKGQIYLGNEKFVSTMQNKIEKSVNDWSIPKKQRRPVAKTLLQIEKQYQDRNLAIVAAYNTGAYSQREIAEHYELHPSTVGVIVRRLKNSQFGTWVTWQ